MNSMSCYSIPQKSFVLHFLSSSGCTFLHLQLGIKTDWNDYMEGIFHRYPERSEDH